jgi:prophage maintenance system killer protein
VVFLDLNGISIDHPSDALYELTMGVAEGRIDKAAAAVELGRIAKSST